MMDAYLQKKYYAFLKMSPGILLPRTHGQIVIGKILAHWLEEFSPSLRTFILSKSQENQFFKNDEQTDICNEGVHLLLKRKQISFHFVSKKLKLNQKSRQIETRTILTIASQL